jgi:hypothetical protein
MEGDYTQNPRSRVDECNGDFSPTVLLDMIEVNPSVNNVDHRRVHFWMMAAHKNGKCVIESLGKMLRLPPATIQQMFEEFPLRVKRQRPLDPSRDGDMMDMLLGYAGLSGARGRLSGRGRSLCIIQVVRSSDLS